MYIKRYKDNQPLFMWRRHVVLVGKQVMVKINPTMFKLKLFSTFVLRCNFNLIDKSDAIYSLDERFCNLWLLVPSVINTTWTHLMMFSLCFSASEAPAGRVHGDVPEGEDRASCKTRGLDQGKTDRSQARHGPCADVPGLTLRVCRGWVSVIVRDRTPERLTRSKLIRESLIWAKLAADPYVSW